MSRVTTPMFLYVNGVYIGCATSINVHRNCTPITTLDSMDVVQVPLEMEFMMEGVILDVEAAERLIAAARSPVKNVRVPYPRRLAEENQA
jgi:hypothetical protein